MTLPPTRIDFFGEHTQENIVSSTPSTPTAIPAEPYEAGPSIRVDFSGEHIHEIVVSSSTSSPLSGSSATVPYAASPPIRLDFEGNHQID